MREGQVLFSGGLEGFRRSAPTEETVLVKVVEVEKAIEVLREKGYSPGIVGDYIALRNAEPSEINALLLGAGLRVEEVKRKEPGLEEVYAMLHRSDV